ncbi:MAG: PD-(D/E)XK nuclease family protein [Bacillota bacterium]
MSKQNIIYLSDTIFGEISHLVSILEKTPETLDTKRVIICEEQFTLSVERELASRLSGIMTTRVLSFGKICDTIKQGESYLSKTSEIMLLSKLLSEISGELELFASASHRPSFASAIYDILSLLCSSSVDFDKLEKEKLPPALEKKISDICKINKKYQSAKAGLFLDATDKMQALFDNFDSVEILKNAEIFIVGHTAFTNQMLAVISKMAVRGGVSCFVLSNGECQKNITQIFDGCGASFSTVQIENQLSPLQKAVLSQTLGGADSRGDSNSGGNAESGGDCDGEIFQNSENANLSLLKFSCEQFETEHIALKIKHLLQNGVKPEEISLTLANFEGMQDAYCEMFDKYEIPYFSALSKTLEKFPFATHILNLATISCEKYSLDSVRRILKSPFSPLTQENSFKFENFLISRNVDRGRFFKDEIFTSEGMLELRDEFLKGTNSFSNLALTASEFCETCENLAVSISPMLENLQYQIAKNSSLENAEFFALSIKKTLETALEMTTVLGDEIFTLERLATIFEGGLCGKEIAIIPAHVHAVEIGDISKSVMTAKKHAFICGASKSFFPACQKDTALLSDKDILLLSPLNINVSPSVEFLNDKAEILASLSLLSGISNLTISHSELTRGGKESECDHFATLSKISPPKILSSECHFATSVLDVSTEDVLKDENLAREVAKITLFETVFSKKHAISLFSTEITKENTVAKEIVSAIYSAFQKNGENAILDKIASVRNIEFAGSSLAKKEISASQLENYFKCPYSSFLSQNIRLFDRELGVLKEFDTGNFLHYLLEEFSYKLADMTESEINTEVAKISAKLTTSPAFSKFSNQEKFQFVFSRLSREAEKICKHIYKSKEVSSFIPTHHELVFGGKNPVATPNGLYLRGKIDRVDICGNDAIVVDYKTGHIDLSEGAFYHGLKIQSELYLYAVANLTKKNPCGCLYLPISDNFDSVPTSYKMRGKLLLDDEVLKNLDKNLENSQTSEVYPITKTKFGKFKKMPSLLERDAFEKHISSAVKTAEQGKSELELGYIAPSPYIEGGHDSCKYCRFVSICKSCGENSSRGGKLSKEDNS